MERLHDRWFRFISFPVIGLMGHIIFFNRNDNGPERFGFLTTDYRNADGKSEEGIGVAPLKRIVNTKEDIQNGKRPCFGISDQDVELIEKRKNNFRNN
ncbi:MAG TPA: hypothetical protein VN726_05625 [Hanamia sp.]|nr:hypothetical protein [Hanamia sp.]